MVEPLKIDAQPFPADSAAAAVLARLDRPAILSLDEAGSIRSWNRGAEILYGWGAEEALGRRLTWLMPDGANDAALLRAEIAAVRITGSGERFERRRRANGNWVAVTVRKVADPTGFVWEVSDRAEAALPGVEVAFGGVGTLLGADVLVFDAEGTLTERSLSESRARISDDAIERARSLALRALRTSDPCEDTEAKTRLWMRAVPVKDQRSPSAMVLVRGVMGEDAESETRRLADLCRRLFDAQEAERRRLARELHDDLGQSLTGLLYALESEKTPREQLLREAAALLAKVRGLSQGLRPGILDDLGLAAALRWLAGEHGGRTRMQVDIACEDSRDRWPGEVETSMFRIAQEAMTNAARHSGASRMVIRVHTQNGDLEMSIEDDGKGFEPSEVAERNTGLASMRERALLLGGRFELESAPDRGTRIRVGLPLLREAMQ